MIPGVWRGGSKGGVKGAPTKKSGEREKSQLFVWGTKVPHAPKMGGGERVARVQEEDPNAQK